MLSSLLERFDRLSIAGQSCVIVLTALIAANLLTLVLYGLFFQERLLLDLVFTSVIAVVVGWPIAYFVMRQNRALKNMAERLRHAAHFDDLTEMLNRRTFIERTSAALHKAGDSGTGAGALLFIDVDRFKSINDTFGHAAGDRVLVAIASAIAECIREGDLAGRFGGEEFAIFLEGADHEEALRISERIRAEVRPASAKAGVEDRDISVSIGLAVHAAGQSLDETLHLADNCLYTAKKRGRDQVVNARAVNSAA